MEIKDQQGKIINIFAIYWFDDRTYFYGFPKGYKGLRSYRANEVTIVDSALKKEWVYYERGVFHWALIREALLDDLLELDETAYNRFLKILKEENLVEPDFY